MELQVTNIEDLGALKIKIWKDFENLFWKFVTKIVNFRHASAKIWPKNLKQHLDWEEGRVPLQFEFFLGSSLATPLFVS